MICVGTPSIQQQTYVKQGKDNLQEYPLIGNKENMQELLYLQEPFILTVYVQMWAGIPGFEKKSLHFWTQKNKYPC